MGVKLTLNEKLKIIGLLGIAAALLFVMLQYFIRIIFK
jgi:hypothetical protein